MSINIGNMPHRSVVTSLPVDHEVPVFIPGYTVIFSSRRQLFPWYLRTGCFSVLCPYSAPCCLRRMPIRSIDIGQEMPSNRVNVPIHDMERR